MTHSYLRIFIAFSCFTNNRGAASENRTTAAGAHRDATDGQLFLKRIINGEKISENPGNLVFTAPYRLCNGECKGRDNFAMVFPLFVGKKGKSDYQSMYPRDYSTAKNKNAPFKPLQTRLPYTTCPTPRPESPTYDLPPTTTNEITSSTTDNLDTSVKTPVTLNCPKQPKCKPKQYAKLRTNSLFSSFGSRTPETIKLRSTLRPLWLRSQQRSEYNRNSNDYEVRPYRTIQGTAAWLALLIFANPTKAVHLPWDQWSWDVPQGPIEHFFRRHNQMPVKSPHFECECPPNEECKLDFELNEEAVDLLNIRGVLNQKEVQQFKDDMEMIKEKTKATLLEKSVRRRRNNEKEPLEPCCCPPQSAAMPTFIAERRFNKVLDNLAFKREEDAHVKTLSPTQ